MALFEPDTNGQLHYRLCGTILASDLRLPELAGAEVPSQPADISFTLGTIPEIAEPNFVLGGIRMDGPRHLVWSVPGYGRYHVAEGRSIVIDPDPAVDEVALRTMLMGPIQAPLWYQRGHLAMHGVALARTSGTVIFVGPSGIGKSFIAALLIERGWSLLADDMCVLTPSGGPVELIPGYAGLRLWDKAAGAISGIEVGESAHASGNKHIMRSINAAPLPTRAAVSDIVMLDLRGPLMTISQCSEAAFLQRWDRNIHLPPVVRSMGLMRQMFDQLHQLVSQGTRIWRAALPDNLEASQDAIDQLILRLSASQ